MSPTLLSGAYLIAAVLLVASAALVAVLVVVRVGGAWLEARRAARDARVRRLLLVALLEDDQDAERALAELEAMKGADGESVDAQTARLIPKLKGASRDSARRLLLTRGAGLRAQRMSHSRSPVKRARAAHRLGALGSSAHLPDLVRLLGDPHFPVRRLAVLGVGAVRDADGVPPLLRAAGDDARLSRELLLALEEIGAEAADPLRAALRQHRAAGSDGSAVAAMALGALGDVTDVALLVEVARHGAGATSAQAARSLGEIGAPQAIPFLEELLRTGDPSGRLAAASALGRIGSPDSVPALAAALDDAGRELSRQVSAAMLALGEPGRTALRPHPSPYAREALAVHALREAS
ncbi:HEAT repeat domain-containing protein [Nocardioides sp.]|uniref:HEAT repeat domain-containing protein n=1 Tax=Nocardioides sp. TaxID=35761 RepID=UPI0027364D6D|nr:HEAT repeat domain-containing protein [Nocardioides sp.]MDP3891185.1 HEAT repeat domain-containing protein [Nocardioides sp.]